MEKLVFSHKTSYFQGKHKWGTILKKITPTSSWETSRMKDLIFFSLHFRKSDTDMTKQ